MDFVPTVPVTSAVPQFSAPLPKICPLLRSGFLAAGQGGDDPVGHTVCLGRDCAWFVKCQEKGGM